MLVQVPPLLPALVPPFDPHSVHTQVYSWVPVPGPLPVLELFRTQMLVLVLVLGALVGLGRGWG